MVIYQYYYNSYANAILKRAYDIIKETPKCYMLKHGRILKENLDRVYSCSYIWSLEENENEVVKIFLANEKLNYEREKERFERVERQFKAMEEKYGS